MITTNISPPHYKKNSVFNMFTLTGAGLVAAGQGIGILMVGSQNNNITKNTMSNFDKGSIGISIDSSGYTNTFTPIITHSSTSSSIDWSSVNKIDNQPVLFLYQANYLTLSSTTILFDSGTPLAPLYVQFYDTFRGTSVWVSAAIAIISSNHVVVDSCVVGAITTGAAGTSQHAAGIVMRADNNITVNNCEVYNIFGVPGGQQGMYVDNANDSGNNDDQR